VQHQIVTALVGLSGTVTGAALALSGTAWQSYTNSKMRRQELAQGQQQALTQLHVDHVNQRRDQRRNSYLAFMEAVAKFVRLTRDDQVDTLGNTGSGERYGELLLAAVGDIDAARDPVILDGPQAVADVAGELCRLPHRVALHAVEILEREPGSDDQLQARTQLRESRDALLRKHTEFMRAGALALHMDGVGNYGTSLPWRPDDG